MPIDILDRGEGKEKERERNINGREKHQLVAFYRCPKWGRNLLPWYVLQPGSEPVTLQPTGNAQPTEPHQPRQHDVTVIYSSQLFSF